MANTKANLSYWNRQFQISEILPDFQEYVTKMSERSAAIELDFERFSYGPDARQLVEITGTPYPSSALPVFIHGGYWRALNAEQHRFVLPALRSVSGAVANLEYRLLPHVTLAEIIGDVLAGLRALSARVDAKLILIGHSAGGHLALSAAHRRPDLISGALAISGLLDLTPLQWTFLRDEVNLSAADLAGHAPQALWHGHNAGHITVAVGQDETPEFHRQAHLFASSHGAGLIEVPNAHHMSVLDDLAQTDGVLVTEVARLLERAEFPAAGPSLGQSSER